VDLVMLLPLVVGVLIVLHIILVRRHGVVPPFDAVPPQEAANETTASVPSQHIAAEPAADATTIGSRS
jgi:quinol-cytochrome oxidoreductase complex cytochrome b subunit